MEKEKDITLYLEEIKRFGIIKQLKETTKGKLYKIINELDNIISIMNNRDGKKLRDVDYHINLNNVENDIDNVKLLIDEIKKYEQT